MDSFLQYSLSLEVQKLSDDESRMEEQVRALEDGFSGLKDIDMVLTLARVKLSLCLLLMRRISRTAEAAGRSELQGKITEKALAALRLVEGLCAENVSEDQKGVIQANPLYAGVKDALQAFLVAGGAGFLEVRETDDRKRRTLSRGVVAAIRKFMGEDDRYPPLEIDRYPPFVQKVLLTLFPVLVHEDPERPPYGIGEDEEEEVFSSRNMKLPLSQAIVYMEEELVPELESRLAGNPGDPGLQQEIREIRERIEVYRKMRFFPRSTPVILEKDFYTQGMTFYSADGEMLVPIPLPVSFRSGKNLDRQMELVRAHVVKRIAGKGVSPSLDRELNRLRSLESGIHGSTRTASLKLDTAWGYRTLRQEYPFLGRLSDREKFKELVNMVRAGSLGASERRVAALIEKDQEDAGPAGLIGISRTDPS